MTHVLVLDSVNEDVFFCGPCKQVFKSLPLFLSHRKNDCKKDLHRLGPPKEVTVNEVSVSGAVNSKIQDAQNEDLCCRLCKKKFKKTSTLHGHLKIHERPYQCLICGRCYLQNSHLQRHLVTHKVWPDSISKTTARTPDVELLSYSCLYCDLIVPSYNQFRVHLKTHLCLKKYKCVQSNCNSFYETIDSLVHHVSSAHTALQFWCHNCNALFHTLEQIATHYQSCNNKCINSVSETKSFKCTQCDASFTKAEKLSLHMVTETHKKICIHCNKIFLSDKRLRIHLQVHRKLKPFQCNICGQSFHVKKYLTSHLLKHGEKKYACKVCKSLFIRQDTLQRHVKSHQIKKLYKCPFTDTLDCKKEFSRTDKLKLHISFHTKKMAASSNENPQHPAGTEEICIDP